MNSEILVVGLDYHTSPVEVREQVAFRPSQLAAAFAQLVSSPAAFLQEAAILSTCNRVEIYGVADDASVAGPALVEFLHTFHGLQPGSLTTALYTLSGKAAVTHLFATACSLNSLVLGEVQIQAQVRHAAGAAAQAEALGPLLNSLFRQAVQAGKRARTETGISLNAASISHAGVELAKQYIGSLRGVRVLLVGSGKVSELSAKNLIDNGADSITLVNRTPERATELASRWGGQTLPFEALPEALRDVDIVLSSTSAPVPVIRVEHARAAMVARAGRPLLLIDLAVPRDIEPDVATVLGIHLYNIDDLASVVATNLQRRQAEVSAVEAIVEDEAGRFLAWLASRSVVPTLNQLRAQADQISRHEVDKALRHLVTLDDHGRAVVESLAASIVNKLLHQPTVRLKHEAATGDASSYTEALHYLFGLDGVPHGT